MKVTEGDAMARRAEIAEAEGRRKQAAQPVQANATASDALLLDAMSIVGDVAIAALDATCCVASAAGEAACTVGGAVAQGTAAVLEGIGSALTDL